MTWSRGVRKWVVVRALGVAAILAALYICYNLPVDNVRASEGKFRNADACLADKEAKILDWRKLRTKSDISLCLSLVFSEIPFGESFDKALQANGLGWIHRTDSPNTTVLCTIRKPGPCSSQRFEGFYIIRPYGFSATMNRGHILVTNNSELVL